MDAGRPTVRAEESLTDDSSGVLVGISVAFAVLTTVFLALRFYAKRFSGVGYSIDDVFLAMAYVFNIGMCALGIVMVRVGGVGRRTAYIQATNPRLLMGWAKCILAFEFIYYITAALPKIGIVLMYIRVFNWKGVMRGLAVGVLCLLAATAISFVVTASFQCRPITFWWDRSIPGGGTCINVQAFFHAQSIPGIILDLIIMVLPLHTIWGLNLPIHNRIALVGIFAVGSVGVIASIIRAAMFFSTSAFEDRTMASVSLVGWSIIETSMYIIAGCLPQLRPIMLRYAPAWLLSAARKFLSQVGTVSSKATRPRYVHHSNRGDDEVELTYNSSPHGISSPENGRSNTLGNGIPHGTSYKATTVASSGDERTTSWAVNPGQVVVTTEVIMERVDSSTYTEATKDETVVTTK